MGSTKNAMERAFLQWLGSPAASLHAWERGVRIVITSRDLSKRID
jgi:hypothetical protein